MTILRTRYKKKNHTFEISLTPLIDTLLVLLVILIVAAPVMHNSLKITLPKAHANTALSQTDSIPTIEVAHDGTIAFNSKLVSIEELVQELETALAHKKDQAVRIEADEKATYEMLITVVDAIKYLAGVEDVILSAKRA